MAGFDNESPNTSPNNEGYRGVKRNQLSPGGLELDLKLTDIGECSASNVDIDIGLEFESPSPSVKSGNGNLAKKKCHLCLHKSHTFFCEDCVEKGNFTHSTARYPERFADKKLKFYGLTEQLKEYNKRIEEKLKTRNSAMEMKHLSCKVRERIKLLQMSMEEKTSKIMQSEENAKKLSEEVTEQRARQPRMTERIQKMLKFRNQYEDRIKTKKSTLEMLNSSLMKVKQENIQFLLRYIFPVNKISEIKRNEEQSQSSSPNSSEAQQLTCLKRHWVVPENQDTEYKILDAMLPANWNYSDYVTWSSVAIKNNETPSVESIYNNPVNRIIAALTYTAQLVAVLAFFLDIRMPKNICYSEFGGADLEEEQFLVKVAKLNINIIHLCLSQNVSSAFLLPTSPLQNLMYLFNPQTSELGRNVPVEIQAELFEAMTQSFKDLNFSILEEEEDDVHLDNEEWETVSNDPSFEPFIVPAQGSTTIVNSQVGPPTLRPSQNPQTTSIAGGLISSLWKAATGQR